MNLELIDCTLRDGGYVNHWNFSDQQIRQIVSSLSNSGIENIECGYLSEKNSFSNNSTRLDSIISINQILEPIKHSIFSNILMMIDFNDYDINQLPEKNHDNLVSGIRLAFHKKDYLDISDTAEKIINKGYKLYIQPMQTASYNETELSELIEICNKIKPEAVYIVDSFGNMYNPQLNRIFSSFDNLLNKNIKIGFHAHNNLQMAYANSIHLISLSIQRNLIIDSSLYGVGRGGGNLNTELITSYLNKKSENNFSKDNSFRKNYDISNILNLLENSISKIFSLNDLTDKVLYMISALKGCHPSYPKYFRDHNLNLKQINRLIDIIETEYLGYFDLKYASIILQQV